MIRLMRVLIRVVVALILAFTLLVCIYHPRVRLLAKAAVGRASFLEAKVAFREVRTLNILERMLKNTRLLRQESGFQLWRSPKGDFWTPMSEEWLLPHLLGEQEQHVYGTGDDGVQKGDIVIDCGAHVGVFTREALRAGAERVIAVEPAPENVECLKRNFPGEIAASRVIIAPVGVWDKADWLSLTSVAGNSARDSFVMDWPNTKEKFKVELIPIDKLVRQLNLPRVDFIKMDIEGAESKALAGAAETLRRHKPRLAISAYHLPGDPLKIPEVVTAAWPGYACRDGPYARVRGEIIPEILYFRTRE